MSSIITRQQVEEATQQAVALNLRDLEQVAREAVERARAKAREILTEGLARAREMERVAAARGEKAGYDAGYAKGQGDGRTEALATETERLREATGSVREALIEVLKEIETHRNDLLAESRQDLLTLAVSIAERICRVRLADGTDHVRPLLEEVIDHAGTRNKLVLRIHPDDAAAAEEFLGELHVALAGDGSSLIKLIPDEKVTRGGCIAERTNGRVDAQIETQIERVVTELIGVDRPAATASGGSA